MIDLVMAAAVPVPLEPVAPHQVVAGSPAAGFVDLGVVGDADWGVWEMTPGAMSDTEADELFIVIAGSATVELHDDGSEIELGPGVVGRLAAGMRTTWTVTETLRKVYVSPRS